MKMVGRVEVPQEAFIGTVFGRGEGKKKVAFCCCSFSGCVLTC